MHSRAIRSCVMQAALRACVTWLFAVAIYGTVLCSVTHAAEATDFAGCWERTTEDEHVGLSVHPENMELRRTILKSDGRRYLIVQSYFPVLDVAGNTVEYKRDGVIKRLRLLEDGRLERSYPHLPNQRSAVLMRCTPENDKLFTLFSPDFSELGGTWGTLEPDGTMPAGAPLFTLDLKEKSIRFRSPELVKAYGAHPMPIHTLTEVAYDAAYKAVTFATDSGQDFWLVKEKSMPSITLGAGRKLRHSPFARAGLLEAKPWRPEQKLHPVALAGKDFARLLYEAARRVRRVSIENGILAKPIITDSMVTTTLYDAFTFTLGPLNDDGTSSHVQLSYAYNATPDTNAFVHSAMRVLELTQPGITRRYGDFIADICREERKPFRLGQWQYVCSKKLEMDEEQRPGIIIFTAEALEDLND